MGRRLEYKAHTDAALLDLIKRGHEVAFAELYERYWTALFLYSRKILRNDNDAEDSVQETLTYIWNRRREIDITGSVTSYLFTAVRHKSLDIINRQRRFDIYLDSFKDFLDKGVNATEENIHERELLQSILKVIAELPPRTQEIFKLSRFEQLSQKRIGEILNISDQTVKNQVTQAMKILRLKINQTMLLLFF